MMHQVQQ